MRCAEPATGVVAEHQAEAQRPEGEHADTEVSVVFHDDVNGVLGSDEATFQQGEARLHEEDQCRAHANPDQVSRVFEQALSACGGGRDQCRGEQTAGEALHTHANPSVAILAVATQVQAWSWRVVRGFAAVGARPAGTHGVEDLPA